MIELSSPIKRKRILAESELLRIEMERPKSAKVPRSVMIILSLAYALLYLWVMNYVFRTISDLSMENSFYIFASIFITLSFVCIGAFAIVLSSRQPLIFTSVGIAGCALMAIKYEQLDGYNWEKWENSKYTLILLPKGIFSEGSCRTRTGESTFGAYGYFFNNEQITAAEEILEKAGVVKVNIRSWR